MTDAHGDRGPIGAGTAWAAFTWHHADDVVEVGPEDREAGVAGLARHAVDQVGDGVVAGQGPHLDAGARARRPRSSRRSGSTG